MTLSILDFPAPATLAALQPYQGLWHGAIFGENTEWVIEDNIEGLLDYNSRVADQPIPQADGEMQLGRWAAGRTVVLPFVIMGSVLTHAAEREAWLRAFAPDAAHSQSWLAFRAGERVLVARGRMTRRGLETSPMMGRAGASRGVVEIKLTDPRVYDGLRGLRSLVVPLGEAVGGGFDLAVEELPLDMTEPSGGVSVANNQGNAEAWPVIRIRNLDPADNITEFELQNVTTGVTVHMIVTIAPGQTLVLDFDRLMQAAPGPHIHIDGNSRFGGWQHPRVPLTLAPGNNLMAGIFTGGDPEVRIDWLEPTL